MEEIINEMIVKLIGFFVACIGLAVIMLLTYIAFTLYADRRERREKKEDYFYVSKIEKTVHVDMIRHEIDFMAKQEEKKDVRKGLEIAKSIVEKHLL